MQLYCTDYCLLQLLLSTIYYLLPTAVVLLTVRGCLLQQ